MNLINQIKRKGKEEEKYVQIVRTPISLSLSMFGFHSLSSSKIRNFTTRRSDDFFILSTLYIGKPKGENR